MIDPQSQAKMRHEINARIEADYDLLRQLRDEIRPLRGGVRRIQLRTTTAILSGYLMHSDDLLDILRRSWFMLRNGIQYDTAEGADLRVVKVRIRSFRGIPNDLVVDFRTEQGDVVSAIVSGDNGTGKSSIVDALEFALQAQINRSQSLKGVSNPLATSLAGAERGSSVEVELSDDTSVFRGITFDEEDKPTTNRKSHKNFAVAPFVLRRADILKFWSTPDAQRQMMFRDYFRSSPQAEWHDAPSEEKLELERERLEAKQKRRAVGARIASRMKIETDQVPLHPGMFEDFVRETFYMGLSSKERREAQNRGVRFHVPRGVYIAIREMREANQHLLEINQKLKAVKEKQSPASKDQIVARIQEAMTKIAQRITVSFCEISTSRDFVERIELSAGDLSEVSLSLKVHLKNGQVATPRGIFSEANLDLLALLIFLAVAKEFANHGQAKFLVLDDVLQSVDSSIRSSAVEYIMKEFADWQLLFTVHDRFWQEQLRVLLRRHNHRFVERDIIRWNFDRGPLIISSSSDMDTPLKEALERGDIYTTCSQAGLLLERMCNTLSYTLPISVIRKRRDKYTLGDLWPGIYKVLRKTSISDVALEIERWLHLRNLVGAHFNEWAGALSRQEALSFGEAVLFLLEYVHCSTCHRWIEESQANGANKSWQCRCGITRVERISSK